MYVFIKQNFLIPTPLSECCFNIFGRCLTTKHRLLVTLNDLVFYCVHLMVLNIHKVPLCNRETFHQVFHFENDKFHNHVLQALCGKQLFTFVC